MTGGNPPTYGSPGTKEEGVVMKEYLIDGKVPEEQILLESRAYHTFHNALYSRNLLSERGAEAQEITIVTHDWHFPRSLLCFQVAWCDTSLPKFQAITVPGDFQSAEVQTRMVHEKQLVTNWVPFCLEQEKKALGCLQKSWHSIP